MPHQRIDKNSGRPSALQPWSASRQWAHGAEGSLPSPGIRSRLPFALSFPAEWIEVRLYMIDVADPVPLQTICLRGSAAWDCLVGPAGLLET